MRSSASLAYWSNFLSKKILLHIQLITFDLFGILDVFQTQVFFHCAARIHGQPDIHQLPMRLDATCAGGQAGTPCCPHVTAVGVGAAPGASSPSSPPFSPPPPAMMEAAAASSGGGAGHAKAAMGFTRDDAPTGQPRPRVPCAPPPARLRRRSAVEPARRETRG